MPLLEVYISQFLAITNQLVKRGIRSDYIRQQTNSQFLKGRLLVSQQIRKNSIAPTHFAIERDEYLVNRPANRLIKLTLELVRRASQAAPNQRMARELCFVFEEVPASTDVNTDFQKVKLSRSMSYYQEVLSWCQLLLNGLGPTASSGSTRRPCLLRPVPLRRGGRSKDSGRRGTRWGRERVAFRRLPVGVRSAVASLRRRAV